MKSPPRCTPAGASSPRAARPISTPPFRAAAAIDIAGKAPLVGDARKFLSEQSPEKRVRAVERLLDSPGYANQMTNIYLDLLIPEAKTDYQRRYLIPTIHDRWLRSNFAKNTPLRQDGTRSLVSVPMQNDPNRMYFYQFYQGGGKPTPIPFYFAKQGKPEELATSVVRVFLGIRLECAQCHNHPFGKWSREEFWSQGRLLRRLQSSPAPPTSSMGRSPSRPTAAR